jgi:hypothetical protein
LVTGQVNAPDPIPVKTRKQQCFHRCHDSPAMLNYLSGLQPGWRKKPK